MNSHHCKEPVYEKLSAASAFIPTVDPSGFYGTWKDIRQQCEKLFYTPTTPLMKCIDFNKVSLSIS